jgi:dTDP-4-amino-4,6-dideoxygalactose transaminase
VSADLAARMLCFPLYSDMSAEEQNMLIASVAALGDQISESDQEHCQNA